MLRLFKQLAYNVPAALMGGAVFWLAYFGLRFGIVLAAIVSLCGYLIAGIWIFPCVTPQTRPVAKERLSSVLREGERKLAFMRTVPYNIRNHDMRRKILVICDIAEKIFETVKKNPKDVKTAQQFSEYYLDSTIKILTRYVELSEHKAYSPEIQQALENVEAVLDKVQAAFEKQLAFVLRHDMLDLNTEIATLEETIDIEAF